jgi:DNA helicase-2/ATP-dependent DNA helicase PcrA
MNPTADPLAGLNPAQKEAASTLDGPLLVVAGAGAGKTKTIAHRIWNLIKHGVAPESILAITFTNKAASEMRERVRTLLTPSVSTTTPFVSTFHALGVFIIKEHSRELGLIKHFTIFDRDDSVAAIKEAMKAEDIDPKQTEPRKILAAISRAKGDGLNLEAYRPTVRGYFGSLVQLVWRRYEETLRERQALDFDDLLLKILELWRKHPAILEQYQKRWHYLHIDEYQDTNQIQYEIAKQLAARHQNICVVGDVDQSIYSWRGADFRNLLRFEEDYPRAKVVLLEQNYRSTKTIIAAANEVIKNNRDRREKNLFTENPEGERIRFWITIDENEEAQRVAERCERLLAERVPAREIAVLYRANFQSRALEEAFLRQGVPYRVLGTRFFERKEVKDVLAWIRAALNPQDIESVKRAINAPPRGIGKVTLAKMVAGSVAAGQVTARMAAQIQDFQTALSEIKAYAETKAPSETIKFVLARSGLEKQLKEGSEDDRERLENIRELATLALKYDATAAPEDALGQLLTEAALASEQDSLNDPAKQAGVSLMTVHAAKGLEFDYVFITGLEQDLFPHRGFDDDEARDGEEERRLFYVALTRARRELTLSYAQIRTIFGSRQVNLPSQFLGEISPELLDAESPGGDPSASGRGHFLIDIDF